MATYLNFNCVYIIQSIPDHEIQTGNDLITTVAYSLYTLNGFTQELIDITSREDFYKAFDHIYVRLTKEDKMPYIHFDMHGSKLGLHLKSKEMISWQELSPILMKINIRTKNNLFISLATCYGAYLFQAADPLARIPFFGYIGPALEITVLDAERDWTAFFVALFKTRNFVEATKMLNKLSVNPSYVFYSGEQIWKIIKKGFLSLHVNRKQRREKLISMIGQAQKMNINLPDHKIRELLKMGIKNRPKFIHELGHYFMLKSDKFPDLW